MVAVGTGVPFDKSGRPDEEVVAELLQVALDLTGGAGLRLLRITALIQPGATLTQQVPALVEGDLELGELTAFGLGIDLALRALGTQLVLTIHQGFDARENVLFAHGVHCTTRAKASPAERTATGRSALDRAA